MMAMISEELIEKYDRLPDDAKLFRRFLDSRGFKFVNREAGAIDSLIFEYMGPKVNVQLTRDRGYWDILISDATRQTPHWFDLKLFTYLLSAEPAPRMSFGDQVVLAVKRWPEILSAFDSERAAATDARLTEARRECMRALTPIWPKAVVNLELFLQSRGLKCIYRLDPVDRFVGKKGWRYSDGQIELKLTCPDYHLEFLNRGNNPPDRFAFPSIRKTLQWPEDHKLGFVEVFGFIETHWSEIVNLVTSTANNDTTELLRMFEDDFRKQRPSAPESE